MRSRERTGESFGMGLVKAGLQSPKFGEPHDAPAEVIAADGNIRVVNRGGDNVLPGEYFERRRDKRPTRRTKVRPLIHPRIMRDRGPGRSAVPSLSFVCPAAWVHSDDQEVVTLR